MRRLNNKGISLLEMIASIVIISFVLASTLTIIVNIQRQTLAANEKINAIEVGTMIRDNLGNEVTFNDLLTWLDTDKVITNQNCSISSAPFSCDTFQVSLDGKDYQNLIEISFNRPNADDLEFGVIHYTVKITYYSIRTTELVGIIYE